MIGTGFTKLSNVLRKQKWTPSLGHEEIEAARRKEDRILWACVTVVLGLIVIGVIAAGSS